MTTIHNNTAKRIMLMSNELPGDVLKRARLIIFTGFSTVIIGEGRERMVLYEKGLDLAAAKCPRVNTKYIGPDAAKEIARGHITADGIEDLPGYLEKMKQAGAIVKETGND